MVQKNTFTLPTKAKFFMKIDFKKILPHLIAIAIFLIVAIAYCKPALEGKVVYQPDVQGWRGMSQQSMEFHEKYGF